MKWLLFFLSIAALVFGQLILAAILFVGACVVDAVVPKKPAKQYDPIGAMLKSMFAASKNQQGEKRTERNDFREPSKY